MSRVITLDDVLKPLDLTSIPISNTRTTSATSKASSDKKELGITVPENASANANAKLVKGKGKSGKNEGTEDSDKIVDVAEKLKKFLDTNGNVTIDKILNESLLKFDNKQQLSMFFVTYKACDVIFKELLKVYNITVPKELVNKTVSTIIPSIIKEFTGNLKKRCKRNANTENLCLGRKLDNKQCSRKRHNGSEFCKSHLKRLSNGRMDQPNSVNTKSKRGRKRKVQFDPRQYDNEYVTLWEDLIDGEKIIIDNNNNIYTFDLESPILLGKKDVNSKLDIIKLIEKYKKKEPSIESKSVSTPSEQSNEINQSNSTSIESTKQEPVAVHKQVSKPVINQNKQDQVQLSSKNKIENINIEKPKAKDKPRSRSKNGNKAT